MHFSCMGVLRMVIHTSVETIDTCKEDRSFDKTILKLTQEFFDMKPSAVRALKFSLPASSSKVFSSCLLRENIYSSLCCNFSSWKSCHNHSLDQWELFFSGSKNSPGNSRSSLCQRWRKRKGGNYGSLIFLTFHVSTANYAVVSSLWSVSNATQEPLLGWDCHGVPWAARTLPPRYHFLMSKSK